MSSFSRAWVWACLALLEILAPGPSVSAQERTGVEPTRQPRKNVEVYNLVEEPTPIVSIKPEGTRVKKGDLVCELESFALREKLTTQEGATKAAETDYKK